VSTGAHAASRPLYFEDLEVGAQWSTAARTITEADIVAFAGLSGDFNPIHVDARHAAGTDFGERIAHGALVLAVATGLRQQEGRFRGTIVAWLGIHDWSFRAPVRIGDTISVLNRVAKLDGTKDPRTGVLVQDVEVHNQDEQVVALGQFATLMRRREAPR
jgi:acyl dehydratase